MGSLLRSEDMVLARLYFQRTAAHDAIEELGRRGLVEFRDMNPTVTAFQRSFAADIKRCDEMQRRLRFLTEQAVRVHREAAAEASASASSASASAEGEQPAVDVADVVPTFPVDDDHVHALSTNELDAHLATLERDVQQMNVHWDALQREMNELVELRHVLELGAEFFRDAASPRAAQSQYGTLSVIEGEFSSSAGESLLSDIEAPTSVPESRGSVLGFFAGTIDTSHVAAFSRIVFRVSRGNCFTRFADIPERLTDSESGEKLYKSVFLLLFPGLELKSKVGKICDAFNANRYAFPEEHAAQMRLYSDVRAKLRDLRTVIDSTVEQRREVLGGIAGKLHMWSSKVLREKAVYCTMDKLNYDMSHRIYVGEAWCARDSLEQVRAAVRAGDERANAQVPSVVEERRAHEEPPTYFRTNKFTEVWQNIVESFGVAKYKEMNAAPWSVASFPFLFAVMFGDVGHGILMTAAALYVVLNERRLGRQRLGEMVQTVYDGRYIILLMGVFSIFTGLIYNECFAIPMNIFGTTWRWNAQSNMACGIDNCADPAKVLPPKRTYPFGFDPFWKGSQTGLTMFNSYKMKLSILLGVAQMVLGIVLSYTNARYFRRDLDVKYAFVPQMIFFNAIFGYLALLIVMKWSINWNAPGAKPAPDLKQILIGMFMSPASLPPETKMFPGQHLLQIVLLAAAVIAVPWMLLPKPLIQRRRAARRGAYKRLAQDSDAGNVTENDDGDGGDDGTGGAAEHAEAFDFVEAFVHNMIHTIEFVLGAISNTASYLRLWALSLAHAELSDVFLQKMLYSALATGNIAACMVGFAMWLGLTIGVLMLMEALSAFLHALRLHWVEFQNKFYNLEGNGVKFCPLDYAQLGKEE